MTKHKLESAIEKIGDALIDINSLYNAGPLNWKGKAASGLYYSEVISEYLLKVGIKERLSYLAPLQRKIYKVPHDGLIHGRTNRHEELCAKEFYKKNLPNIGTIIDYQVPLKARQSDKAGKIDLISVRDNPKNILLIELKYENNTETLLRTALEISTYYHRLSHDNFLSSYDEFAGLKSADIKKAVLVSEGSRAYGDAVMLLELPSLRRLLMELNVDIFGLYRRNEEYVVKRLGTS